MMPLECYSVLCLSTAHLSIEGREELKIKADYANVGMVLLI